MAKLFFLLTLCVSIQFTFLEAQNGKSEPLKSYKEIGDEAFDNNKLDTALMFYKKWLDADPSDYRAWYNLSCLYSVLNNKEEAINAFKVAIDRGWENINHAIKDQDLKNIWEETEFKSEIEKQLKIQDKEELKNSKLHHTKMKSIGSYLAIVPKNYDESKSYPMCVILHGSGSNEMSHGQLTKKFGEQNFVYVVIRAPYPHKSAILSHKKMSWSAWYPDRIEKSDRLYDEMRGFYADWIAECISDARQHYSIKGEKVILFGHSQGAHFAHVFSMKYPRKVSAYLAFAGYNSKSAPFSNEDYKALKKNKVSVTLLHGRQDQVIKYEQSEDLEKLMKRAGVNCKLKLVDAKHTYSKEIVNAVKEWLDCNQTCLERK